MTQSEQGEGRKAKRESAEESGCVGGIGTDRLGVGRQTSEKIGRYVGKTGTGKGKCAVNEQI
jgi:hypothetical protein